MIVNRLLAATTALALLATPVAAQQSEDQRPSLVVAVVVDQLSANLFNQYRPHFRHGLRRLADEEKCDLILTTGGTGPAPRDVTPEATRAVLDRELPGFGEIMRVQSFAKVPTAILSRSTAGTRGTTLIVNLPGNPKAIGECLPLLMPAIREAIRHLHGE